MGSRCVDEIFLMNYWDKIKNNMTVYSELSKIGNTVSYIIVVITATNFFKNYSYNSLNKNHIYEKNVFYGKIPKFLYQS